MPNVVRLREIVEQATADDARDLILAMLEVVRAARVVHPKYAEKSSCKVCRALRHLEAHLRRR